MRSGRKAVGESGEYSLRKSRVKPLRRPCLPCHPKTRPERVLRPGREIKANASRQAGSLVRHVLATADGGKSRVNARINVRRHRPHAAVTHRMRHEITSMVGAGAPIGRQRVMGRPCSKHTEVLRPQRGRRTETKTASSHLQVRETVPLPAAVGRNTGNGPGLRAQGPGRIVGRRLSRTRISFLRFSDQDRLRRAITGDEVPARKREVASRCRGRRLRKRASRKKR